MKQKRISARSRFARPAIVEGLEDRRLLSAAISVSNSVLVFNASVPGFSGGGQPSHTDVLTVTNTGDAALNFTPDSFTAVRDPADSSDESSTFTVANRGSLPASLAPGQSTQVQVYYKATVANTIQSALLQLKGDDPTVPVTNVQLHGLGTPGFFGTAEPSLVNILRAYDIPTIVGAGPNDANSSNSQYPINPDPSSQEVVMPRLVKVGTGPVTISPLASFDVGIQPALRFGYYTAGDLTGLNELFTVAQGDAQTVNPFAQGATSFDPGSNPFGLYATFPGISTSNGQPDTHYSEDAFNTLDSANHRKLRFFPLKNADGSVVPNAYIVAAEDFNSPQYNSFTNLVAIIRNVKPAADAVNSPAIGLENLDVLPSNTRMVFSRIQNHNQFDPAGFTDSVHDTSELRIHNSGDQPLVINSLSLSDTTNWTIVNPPAPGTTVAANGGTLDITVKFIATTTPPHTDNQTNDTTTVNGVSVTDAGGVWDGTLTINTNDAGRSSRTVQLAGYWQNTSENENEPGLGTITNLMFGYTTTISSPSRPNYPNNGSTPTYYGDEVASSLWGVADPTLPISVRQIDAYHNQFDPTNGQEPAARIGWQMPGGSFNLLFQDATGYSQTVFPAISGSTTPASGSFKPPGSFIWNIDGEKSQDSLNTTDINTWHRSGHSVRLFPVKDAQGKLVPNTWLLVMDYQNSQFDNSDYQDVVYYVSNLRPATQAPAPADVQATPSGNGVALAWAGVSDSSLIGYNVYRSSSPGGPYVKLNGSPLTQTTFFDAAAGSAPAYYAVTAVDSSGESQKATASANTSNSTNAPDVLTSLDINSTPAGSTTVVTAGRDYDITAGGADIGGTNADGFRFVYESVTGDFDAIVQVMSLSQVQSGTRAGLIVRDALDAGSRMVFSGATASDGYRFNYRTTADAVGTFVKYGAVAYPNVWVRMSRVGNVFTGFYSTDGVTWVQTQSLTLDLPTTVYLGLAVSSHSTTQTATAQLRNFSVAQSTTTPPGGPGPTPTPTPTPTPPPVGNPPPTGITPAQQVALDRAALKAAQTQRVQQLKAARLTLATDLKAYRAALHSLHLAQAAARRAHQAPTSVDPALTAAVTQALQTVQADRTHLATLQKTDFTGMVAARKTLSADLKILRKSKKQK